MRIARAGLWAAGAALCGLKLAGTLRGHVDGRPDSRTGILLTAVPIVGLVSSRNATDLGASLERSMAAGNVEQDEVGTKSARLQKRGASVPGLAHDLEPARRQELARQAPKAGMVVDDQYPRGHVRMVAYSAGR